MNENEQRNQMGMQKDLEYSSVLQVRLNTQPIMEQFRIYLTGKIYKVAYNDEGKAYVVEEKVAPPKANPMGIQWIENYLALIVNPSSVQANFHKEEMFYWYITRTRLDLAINLARNAPLWGISDSDFQPIIASMMAIIYPFMTRALANKERESYGGMRVIESSTVEQRKGFKLNPFSRGG